MKDTDLEKRLEQELLEASNLCRTKYKYNPSRFLQMMKAEGAVKTSIKLIMAPTYHEGLTRLWELKRLDLTVEAIIIREPYSELFPEEVVNKAKDKLKQLGYSSI